MKIFNTLTQQKEEFEPHDPYNVKIYNCGPTVYNYNHIGNFRSYVFVDILRRYLKFRGYVLNHTSNITDIDDKIIQNAIKENKSIYEFTSVYTQAFLEDLQTLNIEPVEHRPRATDYIPQMIEIIKELERHGHIYTVDGSVYYRISSFPDYGKLSKIDKASLMAGASQRFDVDEYTKEDVRDFALWKKPTMENEPRWNSPYGEGRPGWHIECSAMIRGIYGKGGIDIHIGGVDLIFPHHENEIAQSEGAYPNENFVKYWMHNEHLLVNGKKMSKSLGNFYTLRDLVTKEGVQKLLEENRAPEWLLDLVNNGSIAKAIRYVLLATHYRQKLNFTFDQVEQAHTNITKIQNTINRILKVLKDLYSEEWNTEKLIQVYENKKQQDPHPPGRKNEQLVSSDSPAYNPLKNFIEAMDDDLNISKGLAALFDLIHEVNLLLDKIELQNIQQPEFQQHLKDYLLVLYAINTVLGLFDFDISLSSQLSVEKIQWIESKIQERNLARKQKDFSKADQIREELKKEGIILLDTPTGTKWEILQNKS
ncbi:MAG: cysteine--tRNA ligase [Leptospiraceae bacterium]|nr:cysteine--tRNA ligase [Leptospiraceae bacterium]MDW7977060.1 cysteine--tRNA ligase [Leptospiraceae bacterium]